MFVKFAERITEKLREENTITSEQYEICKYGFQQGLTIILNIGGDAPLASRGSIYREGSISNIDKYIFGATLYCADIPYGNVLISWDADMKA